MRAIDRLRAAGRLEEGIALGPLTSYKLGGPARYLVRVGGEEDLREAYSMSAEEGLQIVALGRGSNVVVADDGFGGIVLRPGPALAHHRISDEGIVVAGSGVPLPLLARETARAGRGGLEFYTGIPGSVGGAVRMNAGCHGSETRDVLISARVFDGATATAGDRSPDDLDLSYRHSNLDDLEFVIEARFETFARPADEAEGTIREISRWRRKNQPGGTLNAGSVFKNPPGDSAGRIIDELGLKGMACGAVSVSERHGNFFVAADGATASDLHRLVGLVRARVLEETGMDLEPEVRFVGEFP